MYLYRKIYFSFPQIKKPGALQHRAKTRKDGKNYFLRN